MRTMLAFDPQPSVKNRVNPSWTRGFRHGQAVFARARPGQDENAPGHLPRGVPHTATPLAVSTSRPRPHRRPR